MELNTIVLIVILVVMVYALTEHWKEKNTLAEENRQKNIAEKEEISKEEIATYGQVQERKNQLLGLIYDNLSEHPQESEQLKEIVEDWSLYLNKIRKGGNSIGAIIEVIAKNLPAGIGAPIYNKLDTQIASAMMSINAVKGVEIGEGMNAATLTGNENADEIRSNSKKNTIYKSNKSGGILGGISTGQDIITRFAVKPTSSILKPKNTIDEKYNNVQIQTTGRHDPCVGIRAVPVGEAMLACVLLDQYLINRGQIG